MLYLKQFWGVVFFFPHLFASKVFGRSNHTLDTKASKADLPPHQKSRQGLSLLLGLLEKVIILPSVNIMYVGL